MANHTFPFEVFEAAFTNGFRYERGGKIYQMEVRPYCELVLPTGRIVAADPGNLDDSVDNYFTETVSPGAYPVDLAIQSYGESHGSANVACMRVAFQQAPIANWVMATTVGQDPATLEPFQMFGYGVDVGMGSFADSAGLVAVLQEYRQQGKYLYEEFYFDVVLPAYEAAEGACNIPLDESTGSNLVICDSGWGDGFYASYWGFDRQGKPVCLITDFGLLTDTIFERKTIGPIMELEAGEIELPQGTLSYQIEVKSDKRVIVTTSGISSAELIFTHNGAAVETAGGSYSTDGDKKTNEIRFAKPLPLETIVEVSYRDRIVPAWLV